MPDYVVELQQTDRTQISLVGGKAAQLGELTRIGGVRVPPGFCVTTAAYAEALCGNRELDGLLEEMSGLAPRERGRIAAVSAAIRRAIEAVPVPAAVAAEVRRALACGDVVPDAYRVCAGRVVGKRVGVKPWRVAARNGGGTLREEVAPGRQGQQVLTDRQILALAELGRRIEAHFGAPQDIEWCCRGGDPRRRDHPGVRPATSQCQVTCKSITSGGKGSSCGCHFLQVRQWRGPGAGCPGSVSRAWLL